MGSNLITPPDIMTDGTKSVLLVEPTESELEAVALYSMNTRDDINIYVYLEAMHDVEWLTHAADVANAVVINTGVSSISPIKDRLATRRNAWHYGPKRFLMSMPHKINAPIDYFIMPSE